MTVCRGRERDTGRVATFSLWSIEPAASESQRRGRWTMEKHALEVPHGL